MRHDAHCYQCGRIGHFKVECPELKMDGTQPKKINLHVVLMDLTADELAELKGLITDLDSEASPQVGPSTDTDLDFL
jgi:hypothetical protein